MQSKGAIKLLAVLLALACVYQLSFTFKTRSVEKKASEYAAQFPLDQQGEAEQHYLDSVQNLGVYNLGFKKFTYKECKEKELNLGLDLKGGMNVMLEVQVEDVVKALAGDSQNDPAFVGAIAEANAALKDGTSKDYISDFVKAYQRLSNGGSLAAIFVSPDRKDITLESSDADVEKILKKETDAAIAASFNVLRSRIDHFFKRPSIQYRTYKSKFHPCILLLNHDCFFLFCRFQACEYCFHCIQHIPSAHFRFMIIYHCFHKRINDSGLRLIIVGLNFVYVV